MTSQENQTSRKTTSSGSSPRPPEQSPKCPRCDSPNTKFCYYNNYSLSQPRHFCKTCRRYWTKGGALRNVPIGGGCRKTNKKSKSSSSSRDSSCTSSTDISSAFKFLHGLSPPIDFQFGRLPSSTNNHLVSFANGSSPSTSSLLGLSGFNWGIQEVGPSNNNVASSIECLSSINQDLHWKLQQQRLAMIMGGDHQNQNQKESINGSVSSSPAAAGLFENQTITPQPILFQNLEISKPVTNVVVSANHANPTTTAADWFFDNPFNSSNNNNNTSNENEGLNNWNGVQAWSYSGLPQ